MPKRALVEKRPWLLASLAAAVSYYFVQDSPAVPGIWLMLWKGAGVGLLGVYALMHHKGADSRTIAAVMVISALADMVLELFFAAGAALFLAAHVVAVVLYLRHRRGVLMPSQKGAGLALLLLTPLAAWGLTRDPGATAYALGLGAMAGSAWTSSFPRYRVGLGAVLFVASDLLIFARMGPLAASALPGLLIWPLYYCGQLLIATGVVGELRNRQSVA